MSHPHLLQSTPEEIATSLACVRADQAVIQDGFIGQVMVSAMLNDAALAHELVPALQSLVDAITAFRLWETPSRLIELERAISIANCHLGN